MLGVPLRAGDELIGLLAAYLERGRTLTENEESLLLALAAQLAVAVQNARLHEKVERESGEAKRARDEAVAVSRRLQALYDISRSFTESLSVSRTLQAIVDSVVDALDVDAAVLRTPDKRGDFLIPAAVRVRDGRLSEPIGQMLSLSQPLSPSGPSVYPRGAAAARRRHGARARSRARAADPVPRKGLDRGGDPAQEPGGGAGDAHAAVAGR